MNYTNYNDGCTNASRIVRIFKTNDQKFMQLHNYIVPYIDDRYTLFVYRAGIAMLKCSKSRINLSSRTRNYITNKYKQCANARGNAIGVPIQCPYANCDVDVEYYTNIDHIVDANKGGLNNPDDLQVLCLQCHQAKTNSTRGSILNSVDIHIDKSRTKKIRHATKTNEFIIFLNELYQILKQYDAELFNRYKLNINQTIKYFKQAHLNSTSRMSLRGRSKQSAIIID